MSRPETPSNRWIERAHADEARPGQYIREYYGVPAEVGRRITFEGRPGVITSFGGARILAQVQGHDQPVPLHPTWEIVYFADCQQCDGRIWWIDCPTGGWWAHNQHPVDNHDAQPTTTDGAPR